MLLETAARITVTDYATLRSRFGYVIDRVMPYVTGGVAMGLASYGTTATVSYPTPIYTGAAVPPPPTPPAVSLSGTDGKNNAPVYGFAVGAGVDWAFAPNWFLRGEYEFVQFQQMRANFSNLRLGLGVRF